MLGRWKPGPIRWEDGDAWEGNVGDERAAVVRPNTYMNLSGQALSPLRYFPDTFDFTRHLLIVTDDFALPHGSFRLRPSGSAGGHNGLVSVEQALGSDQYARLRVGVGPLPPGVGDWAEFVLAPFTTDEQRVLEDLIPTIADAVECWVQDGIEAAMTRYNRKAPAS